MTQASLNNSNRETGVFISSTFRDKHAEKDYMEMSFFKLM